MYIMNKHLLIVTTTISLILFFGIIIILTAIFSSEKYIVADEILICIATILILTDNLMLKNNAIMIEDLQEAMEKRLEKMFLAMLESAYSGDSGGFSSGGGGAF